MPRVASTDGDEWLAGDDVADSLTPVLAAFFDEMWPVLRSSAERLTTFIASDAHECGGEL